MKTAKSLVRNFVCSQREQLKSFLNAQVSLLARSQREQYKSFLNGQVSLMAMHTGYCV